MPEEKFGKLVEFKKPLYRRIKRAAADQSSSVTAWIAQACEEKLQRDTAIAAAQTAGQEQGK